MKRKLSSSQKGKGSQAITKFFKALTPQGTKQSHPSVDNPVKMKTTKEEEFRTSLFEKFQTSKTSSKDSTCNALSKDNAENDKGKSCNSASPINQTCHSSPDKNKAGYGSNPALSNQKRVQNSTPIGDVAICKNALINCNTQLPRSDLADVSGMDCDETFLSATEEVDISHYDTCHESLTDLSFAAQHNATSKGDFLDASLKRIKESNVHKESTTDKLQKGESSNGVDNKECNETVAQIDNLLMLKVEESDVNTSEQSENEDLDKDRRSSCDSVMEDEQVHDCHDLKREESDKSCNQINKPCGIYGVLPEASYSSSDCKEDENSDFLQKEEYEKECNHISKPFNKIRLDSDVPTSDGDISEGSESDDDLLTPPRFLYEKLQLKPNVRTPEKGIVPAFSTPSPVIKDVVKEDKTKYKLSFEKLIKEKVKRKEKDAELAEMEAELQRGLEKGGIAQMQVPSSFSDIESEEELTDDGRDLKDCTLPKDIKKFLVDVHDFTEDLPGEDIFPMFHPYVTSQDFPRLSMLPHPENSSFEAKVVSGSDADLQELICGGWILQHYLDWPCPSEVSEWLFQVMCRHQDQHVISSTFQVMWVMVETATENREDIPQDPRGSLWVPSIKKVIKELLSLGARVPRLFPGDLVTQLNIKEILSDSPSEDMEDVTGSGKPQTERFPLVNIMHLVQFLTHCLQKCPRCYVVQELQNLAVLLCRLALDVRLQTVVFDIEMCLAAVLNCFGEMQWPDEIKELCRVMAKLSTDHRNLLHLVQIQPPSVRGIQLQRLLGVTLLHWLVPKFGQQQETGRRTDDERCDVAVPDTVEVSSLVKLVEQIKPKEDSDYFLLHTIISLLSLAVGSEDLPPKERAPLEKLTNKLRSLNGDIKDPRAAFMNRTKVKDLLVRTLLRLAYMAQCIKPSREHHIASYFEYESSNLEIELLKDREEKFGNEEEENAVGEQDMMDCGPEN